MASNETLFEGLQIYWLKLKNVYSLTCVIATLILQIYCLTHYLSDKDVSMVDYTKFHTSHDAIYPSISICISPPFVEEKFDQFEDISYEEYQKFWIDKSWDDRVLKVDYDNVTVSLSDNLITAFYTAHGSTVRQWVPDHFVSFRSPDRKCFTINAPILKNKQLGFFEIMISNEIFPGGQRRFTEPNRPSSLYTYFHYPGQRFTSYHTEKKNWISRANKTKGYFMSFRIKNIDVITNRNKPNNRCLVDWRKHDEYIMNSIMKETGCRPPHWIPSTNLSFCHKKEQIINFRSQPFTDKVESYDPPYKHIERLDFIYRETDDNK